MQLKKVTFTTIFLWSSFILFAQKNIKQLDKTQVNILYNYYEQDGNNGAVTGGLGTEKLDNSAPQITISIPVNKVSTFGASIGLDHYTSASTANIDKYGNESTTSASTSSTNIERGNSLASEDTRKYFSLNFNRNIPDKQTIVSVLYGHSEEFDVNSNYGKITWQKNSKDGNKFLSINAGIFIDKWLLIYPGEIRAGRNKGVVNYSDDDDDDDDDYRNPKSLTKTDYESDTRFTYNIGITFGGNINQRLNASLTAEIIIQRGLLSTPFHRVYFNDGISVEKNKLVKIEHLPKRRIKKGLGIIANYYLNNFLITRFFYRFYNDDFGITGHTLELEIPLKLDSGLTFYPFYRFHTQTKANHFQPYKQHDLSAEYYTSDYDLSSFETNKTGIGLKFSPSDGVLSFNINKKKKFQFKSLEFRISNFSRTTGLNATSVTLNNVFTF
ncbi:MAG TPA: hypothetical protein DDY16_00770 [Tenacibaculum sp.]|nr:hypothetical protein [Tenacibaculum sp.]